MSYEKHQKNNSLETDKMSNYDFLLKLCFLHQESIPTMKQHFIREQA